MPILNSTKLHLDYSVFSLFKNADGSNPADYKVARNNYLANKENDKLFREINPVSPIHDDSKHLPTIGYGFNLDAFSIDKIKTAFQYVFGTLSVTQNSGIAVLDRWKNSQNYSASQKLTAQNIIDIAGGTYGTASEKSALASLTLTASQAYNLLDGMLDGEVKDSAGVAISNYEANLSSKLGVGDLGFSTERIALLSAFYNAPALIGNGIKAAVNHDDHTSRAEAWFQLLYYHANYKNQSAMDRREEEAKNLLHLTSDQPDHNLHIEELKYALDFLFNGKAASDNVDVYSTIQARDTLKNFETEIKPELTELAKEFALGYNATLDFVQRDKDGQSSTVDAKAASGKTDDNTNNIIFGEDGNDTLNGKGGDDILLGGTDDDTLLGGTGSDTIDGGSGTDTASYADSAVAISYNVKTGKVTQGTDTDTLTGIERIIGSTSDSDVIDFSGFGLPQSEFAFKDSTDATGKHYTTVSLKSTGKLVVAYADIERVNFTGNTPEKVIYTPVSNTFTVKELHMGDGADTVDIAGTDLGLQIFLEGGDDILKEAPVGAIVYGGAGADSFELADGYLIADAETTDHITYHGHILSGGVRWKGQESPWAKGLWGVKYGRNANNELVIETPDGRQTFVDHFNFNLVGGRTAGILVGEFSMTYLMGIVRAGGLHLYDSFEALFGYYFKAMFGFSQFAGVDPLMLDLDGDGLELNARISTAPYYDVDADGFAEQTGWLRGDDGFLVRDNNGNGKIDNVSEMFGNATTTGFNALKALDSNADGKITSADANWGVLKVWRDLNGNAVTDAGELQTLAQAGITSINLTNTATNQDIAGNILTATSSFTKTDGTTGTIGDVTLRTNQRDTIWLGDKTIDAASAALPEVKGYGTLVDLRIAMTDSATLKTAVTNALPALGSLNLASMRSAVLPVLNAWRAATPVPSGTAGTVARSDVPILTQTNATGIVVNDFAYKVTDAQGTYWKLASGASVLNSSGVVIARPTATQVLAQTSTNGTWTNFTGQQIQFAERFLGVEIPFGVNNLSGAASISAAGHVIEEMWGIVNDVAMRLAVQGPLASYFQGIKYNAVTNHFEATTDKMLVPTLQAIFAAAPASVSGATAHLATWKPILDVFLNGFDRASDNLVVSYAFLFQNIVAAYENTGLAATVVQAADALGIPSDLVHIGVGTVNGGNDADLFYLGAGDQIAQGGQGPDSYIVGKNFGHDVVNDVEAQFSGTPDTLRFAQYNSSQLSFVREGLDLVIHLNGAPDDLRVVNQFYGQRGIDPDYGVTEIIFANGEVWDNLDIAKAVSTHTNGDDNIIGTGAIDYLDGGLGNDTLMGEGDGDVYSFGLGDGQDVIHDNIGYITLDTPDIVQFKAGLTSDMVTFTRDGNSSDLVIKINGTTDQLTIQGQFDATYTGVYGTIFMNQIEGFSFADGVVISADDVYDMVLDALRTDGNDTIYGFSREDVIDGGAGDDYLSGGNENDTYVMWLGYGHDTIFEGMTNALSGTEDKIQFLDGVLPSEVTISRPAATNDLVFTLVDGSSVIIKEEFSTLSDFFTFAFNRVESFVFADGTTWTYDFIKQKLLDINSTAGDDTIYGYMAADDIINGGDGNDYINSLSGTDIITGGKGNDTLTGNGDTTYLYNQGDGVDNIIEGYFGGDDTVRFTGVALTSTNFNITRSSDLMSATLTFGGVADSVTLTDEFNINGAGVENFVFSDGVSLTRNDLQLKYLASVSTAGNDTIYGFGWSAFTNPIIDIINGGKGNDYMNGLGGDDLYIHAQGDGVDTIEDGFFGGDETLQLTGAALTSTNAIFTRSGFSNDTTLSFTGVSDQIILVGEFAGHGYGIENITFSNGVTFHSTDIALNILAHAATTGNDTIYGFYDSADTLVGGLGNDYMNGQTGDDTYIHNQGDGADTIEDSYYDLNDNLKLNGASLTSTNVKTAPRIDGLDIITLNFSGVSDSITLSGIFSANDSSGVDRVTFSNGVIWTKHDLQVKYFADAGTVGADTIYGFAENDIITGGKGNDFINGMSGDDSYIHNQGDGVDTIEEGYFNGNDTLKFTGAGLTSTNAKFTRDITNLDNLVVGFTGLADKVILLNEFGPYGAGVENIVFSNGVTMNLLDIKAKTLADSSTSGNDTIYGYSDLNDIITGGKGNDLMNGRDGDDTYIHNQGDGVDTIDDWSGNDTLVLTGSLLNSGNAIFSRDAADSNKAILSFSGVTDQVNLAHEFAGGDGGIENIKFSDGVTFNIGDIFVGDSLDNSLVGNVNNNIMFGGSGNDTLNGDAGNDIMLGGAGADKINGGVGIDTASYADSNAAVTVNLNLATAQTGGTGYSVGDTLTGIENIIGSAFADKLTGDAGINNIIGGAGNDTIIGGAGADVIDGGAGVDTASYATSNVGVNINLATNVNTLGHAAGDSLVNIENIIGSNFNDIITGNTIANILSGGSGKDTLTGGLGADKFAYSAITDSGAVAGARDIITDFVEGTDKIDLSAFTGTFNFNGTGALSTGGVHSVDYAQVGGNTIVNVDADGNGVLDFQIELTGLHTLAAGDFLL